MRCCSLLLAFTHCTETCKLIQDQITVNWSNCFKPLHLLMIHVAYLYGRMPTCLPSFHWSYALLMEWGDEFDLPRYYESDEIWWVFICYFWLWISVTVMQILKYMTQYKPEMLQDRSIHAWGSVLCFFSWFPLLSSGTICLVIAHYL